MADQFTKAPLGQCVNGTPKYTFEAVVVTAAVTVGQAVELVHVATDLPKVTPAADASLVFGGVVMAFLDGGTGQVGERVLVGKGGLFVVKAGASGMTAGKKVMCETSGQFSDAPIAALGDITKSVGRAWQTAASGEKALAWID